VVLNLGSIENLLMRSLTTAHVGFDGAVSGVREMSSELQNSANVFGYSLFITTVYFQIEHSSVS